MDMAGKKAQLLGCGRIARDAATWYWQHGTKRAGAHLVSPVWLDEVTTHAELVDSVAGALGSGKAAIALWGPSQSGKSTLISGLIDASCDEKGRGGALDWGEPTCFSSRHGLSDGIVVYNPQNLGSDASGCVSRFVLADERSVPSLTHPVVIRLLTRPQLLHAIAAGYASECRDGEDVRWTSKGMEELLGDIDIRHAPASQEAFALLHDCLTVVDLLIAAQHPRFRELDIDGGWRKSTRARLLQTQGLLVSPAATMAFVSKLLWDSKAPLTELYEQMSQFLRKLPADGKPVCCSMSLASVLVDIDAYKFARNPDAQNTDTGRPRRILSAARSLSWEERDGRILIGIGFSNSLVGTTDDFGVFQGLVAELVIPLRRKAIAPGSVFLQFMERFELVDFPGVPLKDSTVQANRLDLESMQEADRPRLLTEVIKRGKTLSIVDGYGSYLGIDAFVLLVRAGNFPAKPQQLHAGIVNWWRNADSDYDVYRHPPTTPPLPVFLNLTFFGAIVDLVVNGAADKGLAPLIDMIHQLDPLTSPGICEPLATTYPQFTTGKIHSPAGVEAAVAQILVDQNIRTRFTSDASIESIRRMACSEEGGVEHLLSVLVSRVGVDKRVALTQQRLQRTVSRLLALCTEHVPCESGSQRVRDDVDQFSLAIRSALRAKGQDPDVRDPAACVGYHLRSLFNVDASVLDPIPLEASVTQRSLVPYVELQIQRWIDSKRDIRDMDVIGLGDWALRARILTYLSQRLATKSTAQWLRNELGHIRNRSDASEARRSLALHLGKAMLNGHTDRAHLEMGGPEGVLEKVRTWAEHEATAGAEGYGRVEESPHYTKVVLPAMSLLDEIKAQAVNARLPQPGDTEIAAICHELSSHPALK